MSQFPVMSLEEIQTLASAKNCSVIVAQSNQLQFDLDTPESYHRWASFYHVKLSSRFKEGMSVEEWDSAGGNKHVVVTLPSELSVPDRIALQAQGGSDYGREFAALMCHWDGSPHPLILFKPEAK